MRRYLVTFIIGLFFLVACNTPRSGEEAGKMGLWAERTPYQWTHDGKPRRTKHFTIYTDAASETEKEKLARGLEIFLKNLTDRLEIDPDSVEWYPSRTNPFVVYMNRTHTEPPGGHAFHGGFIVDSPDAPFFQNPYPGHYGKLVQHELAHVIDMAMLTSALSEPPRWFREGFAHFLSGQRLSDILGSEGLDYLVRELGYHPSEWTPLAIVRHEDYPREIRENFQVGRYYALFEVSVRYIDYWIRENGEGHIRTIYDLMGQGMLFESAFENAAGFSLETFERHFFEWVGNWLDNGGDKL